MSLLWFAPDEDSLRFTFYLLLHELPSHKLSPAERGAIAAAVPVLVRAIHKDFNIQMSQTSEPREVFFTCPAESGALGLVYLVNDDLAPEGAAADLVMAVVYLTLNSLKFRRRMYKLFEHSIRVLPSGRPREVKELLTLLMEFTRSRPVFAATPTMQRRQQELEDQWRSVLEKPGGTDAPGA